MKCQYFFIIKKCTFSCDVLHVTDSDLKKHTLLPTLRPLTKYGIIEYIKV